jgi:hypothetical protein
MPLASRCLPDGAACVDCLHARLSRCAHHSSTCGKPPNVAFVPRVRPLPPPYVGITKRPGERGGTAPSRGAACTTPAPTTAAWSLLPKSKRRAALEGRHPPRRRWRWVLAAAPPPLPLPCDVRLPHDPAPSLDESGDCSACPQHRPPPPSGKVKGLVDVRAQARTHGLRPLRPIPAFVFAAHPRLCFKSRPCSKAHAAAGWPSCGTLGSGWAARRTSAAAPAACCATSARTPTWRGACLSLCGTAGRGPPRGTRGVGAARAREPPHGLPQGSWVGTEVQCCAVLCGATPPLRGARRGHAAHPSSFLSLRDLNQRKRHRPPQPPQPPQQYRLSVATWCFVPTSHACVRRCCRWHPKASPRARFSFRVRWK